MKLMNNERLPRIKKTNKANIRYLTFNAKLTRYKYVVHLIVRSYKSNNQIGTFYIYKIKHDN